MSFFQRFQQWFKFGKFVQSVDLRDSTKAAAKPAAVPSGVEPSAPTPEASAVESRAGKTLRRFATPDTLARLPKLARRDLDALPFGCVRVGDDGRVLSYNKWESELAGVPQEDAIGRNFFRELAPCTNNRLVFGRFKDGIKDGELDVIVTYSFTYKMRPTLVDVHLYRDTETQSNWVLVRKSEPSK